MMLSRRTEISFGALARTLGIVGVGCSWALAPLGCALPQPAGQPRAVARAAAPFDASEIVNPVLSRVWMTPEQAAGARVFLPEGTRAYFAGESLDDRPDTLAWYSTKTGRLVAAIRIDPVNEAAPIRDGVGVTSGRAADARPAAIVAIRSRDTVPALLSPEGTVTLRARGKTPFAAGAAPLLSIQGSSTLHGLTGPADPEFHAAGAFDVVAAGPDGEFRETLKASGGSPPIVSRATFTRKGAVADIIFGNQADTDFLVPYRLPSDLRKVQPGPDALVVHAGEEGRVRVVPERSGNFQVPFEAVPLEPLTDDGVAGPASGLAVADAGGAFSASFISGQPVRQVTCDDGASVITRTGQPVPTSRSGRSSDLTPIAITGGVAAAFGIAKLLFAGPDSAVTIATVPATLDQADEAASGEPRNDPDAVVVTMVPAAGCWLAPRFQDTDCWCTFAGQVQVADASVKCNHTSIDVTAKLKAVLSIITLGPKGERTVTITVGTPEVELSAESGGRDRSLRVVLTVDASCSFPGGDRSKNIKIKCSDQKTETFECDLKASGRWTEDSHLDDVFRKGGKTATLSVRVPVSVSGCEKDERFVAEAKFEVKYKSNALTTGGDWHFMIEGAEQPAFRAIRDPCATDRARLACWFACVHGISCKAIQGLAKAYGMDAESVVEDIKRCCPKCESANRLADIMKCLRSVAGTMNPAKAPQVPPPPTEPVPEQPPP